MAEPSGDHTPPGGFVFGLIVEPLLSAARRKLIAPGMPGAPIQNRQRVSPGRPLFDRPDVMSGQILKLSISLAAIATSAVSLLAISWIGLGLLGF
jgi:hypothetical protein